MENQNDQELISTLQSLGLTEYETRTYISLLSLGVADARTLCSNSNVPSSKIYSIMEKFQLMGLAVVQQSKPAMFRALDPSIGLTKLMAKREKEIDSLKETLPLLQSELDEIFMSSNEKLGRSKTFFNLEFGMKNHVQKHLPYLAGAKTEVLSYFESTCLNGARIYGQAVKQDIVKNIVGNGIRSNVIFGVKDRKLIDGFVKGLPETKNIQIRITAQLHAPFHVIDGRSVITVIDNPLFKDGRIASLYIMDNSLAKELHEGYRSLWENAKPL